MNLIDRIKKMNTKKYILAAATLLGLAACQQEDTLASAYDTDPNAVKISASIAGVDNVQTRINTDGEGAAWTNNDMIQVTNTSSNAIKGKTKANYTHTTNKWELNGADYMVWADGENTFEAFYPYENGTATTSFTAFVLPSDQSEVAKISKADWMLATAVQSKGDNKTVDLEFAHQFAKVTVKIAKYNNEFGTLPGIEDVNNPKFTVPTTLTQFTGKKVTVENYTPSIAALKVEDISDNKQHFFTAVLLPGMYSAEGDFFQLEVNGTAYKAKVSAGSVLTTGIESGKAYTFNLTVGKDVITIGNITVEDWGVSDWIDGVGGTAEEQLP